MLGFLVFAASFACFFSVTVIFQNMPPGALLIDFFGNSEVADFVIFGMSSETFIASIINGFSWGLIITLVFFFLRGPGNKKRELPIWVPNYAKSENS